MSPYDQSYFEHRVSQFYEGVDRDFRTLGCEKIGTHDIGFRLSRMATPTVEYSEIKRICADIDGTPLHANDASGHRRWPMAWGRASKRYKEIGEQAENRGHQVTACLNFLRASLLAHSGQMFCRPEWPEKLELQKERTECYRRAAPGLGIERIEIPYKGHHLPGYMWTPETSSKPPVVIMAPGANSVKEELHRWAQAFRTRGIATLTFDGPGQGELTPLQGSALPMRIEEYHQAFTAVIDHLERNYQATVDVERIALWGQSLGGYFVTRTYAFEKRPIALVNLGGPPTMMQYPHLPGDVVEEMRDLMGFQTMEETWTYFQEHSDALHFAKEIDIPFLIIHGSRDDLIEDSLMDRLVETVGDTAELIVYKDGNHGVFNWDFVMTDRMADWLADRLSIDGHIERPPVGTS